MKVSYSKGLHMAGLLALTLQLLVQLFEYIVNSVSIFDFLVENWASVGGYILLAVLFLKKNKVNTDHILTVIGVLAWIVQFSNAFDEYSEEVLVGFLYCACGILGVALVIMGLFFDLKAEHDNNEEK